MANGKLGILGGMGPQATMEFYQRVIAATAAGSDQEHIETLILSDSQIPDRTAALLSGETEAVFARLLSDARFLADWGAAAIAVPCNTAHAFVPQLQARLDVPIVNMVTETAAALRAAGARRVGILGTDGTIRMGLYHAALQAAGMEPVSVPAAEQEGIMRIIYDEIKQGRPGSMENFAPADAALRAAGCDRGVLACTELSVFGQYHHLPAFYLDAMDILARRCVTLCGYPLR